MAKPKQAKHKKVIWVSNYNLGMALLCRGNRVIKTFEDRITNQIEWLFADTTKTKEDIKKFETRKLKVEANKYSVCLTGRFYEDE